MSRLLASTPSLDLTLATTSYTLSLIAAVVPRLGTISPSSTSASKQPVDKTVDQLERLLTRLPLSLKRLSSVLSEARTTLRLFGLVGVYTSLHSTITSPPKDGVLKAIQWGQVIAGAVFQVCENMAFLGDKDIITSKRLGPRQRGKLWKLCCQAWLAATFLELARIARDFSLRQTPKLEHKRTRWAPEGTEAGKVLARIRERNAAQEPIELTREDGAEMKAAEEKLPGSSRKVVERIRASRSRSMEKPLTEEELEEVDAACERDNAAELSRLESEEAAGRDVLPTKLMINAAYAPMTVHYSLDNGFMSDYELSLCGLVASGLGLAEAWKRTE